MELDPAVGADHSGPAADDHRDADGDRTSRTAAGPAAASAARLPRRGTAPAGRRRGLRRGAAQGPAAGRRHSRRASRRRSRPRRPLRRRRRPATAQASARAAREAPTGADRGATAKRASSGPRRNRRPSRGEASVMSNTEVVVARLPPTLLAAATAARLVTRLVDIQAVRPDPVGGAHRRRHRHRRAGADRRLPGPRRRRLATGRDLLGRRAFRPGRRPTSATRSRPARRCWTASRSTRRGCTRWRRRTARSATTWTPRPRPTAGWSPPRRASTSLLLGMGPDGHVASIFPESPAVYDDRPVVAVRNCPEAAADPDLADACRPSAPPTRSGW